MTLKLATFKSLLSSRAAATSESASIDPEKQGSLDAPRNSTEKSPDDNACADAPSSLPHDSKGEVPAEDAQGGVKRAEAITLVWSKRSLYITYSLIFLIHFINSLQQSVTSNLTAYVLSDFAEHSLVPVASICSSIMGGVLKLPQAKIIDLWGRAEGFAVMTFIATIGLVLMAVCTNVQTYAAAQVFYWVGFDGITYILDVIVADTSNLRNRSLAFAYMSSPYIVTTFAGPKAAESFYLHSGWRWAFGCFSIITPVVALPIFGVLYVNQLKAKKEGVLVKEPSGRTWMQSISYYAVEFDFAGIILLCAGLVLFLLPFSLAADDAHQWRTASIIAMLVIGFVLIIAFFAYERFIAPKCFIPYHLLLSRTVIGACLLSGTLFVAYYCWDGYFTSYLQVVNGLSISDAGYLSNTYSVGSCLFAIVVGALIRVTGRFKWLALYFGMPLQLLGGGLMIYFRQPNQNIGFVVMCQIFIAFAGGTLVICEQMAVMAVAEHGDIAALLALEGMFAAIGGAIGSSVSGAIWTNTLFPALLARLPADAQDQAAEIYASLAVQLTYPIGDPVRTAIQGAYGVAQERMCIAGTAVLVLGFVWVAMWRDVKVSELRQMKGTLF